MFEYVVAVVPEFDTMVPHVIPPSVDLSILYPVMAEPPVSLGAFQLRLICDDEITLAVRFVGGPSTDICAFAYWSVDNNIESENTIVR